jgi:hypothetical protein
MVIQTGYQTFDFLKESEIPRPLRFSTEQDALHWLKNQSSQHADLMPRLREYLARHAADAGGSRLTDYQVIERMALLLYSRRVVVIARANRTAGGKPTPREEVVAPPFPLSERKQRAPVNGFQKVTKTWIAIELQDSDGNPVAGEKYKIELTDGRIVEGKLDSSGMAKVSQIDPGQCRVTFPRLDASIWAYASASAE